jgi:hypothetical protein
VIDRSTPEQRLAAREADVPALPADRNAVPGAFGARAQRVVSGRDAHAQTRARWRREAIVERCGVNG